jgi:uncharacterized membrane protein
MVKKDLEIMYKELIRIIFDQTPTPSGGQESSVSKEDIIPLERKINTLVMKIND